MVCLSGLPGLLSFDAVGEPATLAQRWLTWKEEFELYVTASGISDSTQKRALLLHLAGPKVRDIFNNSIPEEIRGDAKDYKKAMDALSDHFKMQKNVPMARQAFIAAKPLVGETINNFITRLQTLAEHCDYEGERDNQVRDHAISYIKDKNLKSKLYRDREETLTLGKLMEIVGHYHDREALILLPESVNRVIQGDRKTKGKCWRCDKAGHYAKECRISRDHKCTKCGKVGHFESCCYSTSQRGRGVNRRGACGRGKSRGRGGQTERDHVRQLDEEAEKQGSNSDFYVFNADDANEGNVLKLRIEDKIINIIIDAGASCNLISEQVFNQIAGGKVDLSACDKKVFAYAATKPIEPKGKM